MKKKVLNALNNQIKEEMESFYLYLSMATYFDSINLNGFAAWMKHQANEEYGHAMKIYGFIDERGEKVELEALAKPASTWKSPLAAFEDAYKHEVFISGCIHKLVKTASAEDDLPTMNFLQWFIQEQVEEEATASDIVEKLKMVGDSSHALFMFDRVLGERK